MVSKTNKKFKEAFATTFETAQKGHYGCPWNHGTSMQTLSKLQDGAHLGQWACFCWDPKLCKNRLDVDVASTIKTWAFQKKKKKRSVFSK